MSWYIFLSYPAFVAALTRDDVRERKLKEVLSKKEFKDLTSWGYSKNAIKMAAGEVF